MEEFLSQFSVELFAAIFSLILGILGNTTFEKLFLLVKKLIKPTEVSITESYKNRIEKLSNNLLHASDEVDQIINEITTISKEREKSLAEIEENLAALGNREKELKKRIEELENVPVEAAEYFAKIVEKGERKSVWRDIILFVLGVIVTTGIAILLSVLGY